MDDSRLKRLYVAVFASPMLPSELAARCSAPLLLSAKSSWARSAFRLLIIGQETLGWCFRPGLYYDWPYQPIKTYSEFFEARNRVDALMHGYRVFDFAAQQPENHRSPFWRAFRFLGASLATEPLWSNLFRFSVDGGSVIRNCSSSELAAVNAAQSGLLAQEISALSPSAVVFFTGPNYDRTLQGQFVDISFSPVDSHELRHFASLSSAALPRLAFRLYHPGYLARSEERWSLLSQLAQMLAPNPSLNAGR